MVGVHIVQTDGRERSSPSCQLTVSGSAESDGRGGAGDLRGRTRSAPALSGPSAAPLRQPPPQDRTEPVLGYHAVGGFTGSDCSQWGY